jgi:hypothetical protein
MQTGVARVPVTHFESALGGQSVAGAAGGMAAGAPPVLLRGHHGPKIPEPEEPWELTDADPTAQPAASTS